VITCLTGRWSRLDDDDHAAMAHVPLHDLLGLPFLTPEVLGSPVTAYRVAQRANQLRARAASCAWSSFGGRINTITAGTGTGTYPLATLDTGTPPGPDSPTPADIAVTTHFLTGSAAQSINGADVLIDNGAAAAHWSSPDDGAFGACLRHHFSH
jgi:NAD(P)-dependent dehydrogenase (short-subunit alcohol dehydrogenase family)